MTDSQVVNILFLGDFGVQSVDNISIGSLLSKEIDSAQIVGINFEGCLNEGEIISPNKKAIPQSEESAKWCKTNGINLFSLANNHIMDFGEIGLNKTLESFPSDCNIIGVGTFDEAYQAKYITINGIKIGFIGGSSADFSSLKSEWDDKDKKGCAWINSPRFTLSIMEAKKQCDHLFVISHAGVEYLDIPLPEWRDLYRFWIDLGVSGVIASHPHVPQGIEKYNGHPIYYSLGNFLFEGTPKSVEPKYWNNSIGGKIRISKDSIVEFSFIPIKYESGECEVDSSDSALAHINNLNEILGDDSKYIQTLNALIPDFADIYNSYLHSSMNAVIVNRTFGCIKRFIMAFLKGNPNDKSLLHQLREESTILTIIRNLKSKTNSYL